MNSSSLYTLFYSVIYNSVQCAYTYWGIFPTLNWHVYSILSVTAVNFNHKKLIRNLKTLIYFLFLMLIFTCLTFCSRRLCSCSGSRLDLKILPRRPPRNPRVSWPDQMKDDLPNLLCFTGSSSLFLICASPII